jgi:hypothetical protein
MKRLPELAPQYNSSFCTVMPFRVNHPSTSMLLQVRSPQKYKSANNANNRVISQSLKC